jgi:type II secretory pathway pseudopilin PulG
MNPSRTPGSQGLRGARRRAARGFTIIELSVALIAGLLVAMALVQTSKEATNTFHEEVRAAAAEMSLRLALERLRADLQRVAFMSTPNIQGDPMIAKLAGTTNPLGNLTVPVLGLSRLAGIQLNIGGSAATAPLSTNANNGLNPDSIELGGNYSTVDEFAGFMCPAPPTGAGCGGLTVCLEWNTPAMWRIRNTGVNAAQTLQAYFNPTNNGVTTTGATRYMARLTDDSGHYQYLLTCGGTATTSFGATGASINLDPGSKILTPGQTAGHGGVGGLDAGRIVISPVEIVHWQILQATSGSIPANYHFGATGTPDPNEYVLTRQYVDAVTNLPDPATMEVVSEYAVDLKFAFTVDSEPATLSTPGAAPNGTNPILLFQLDSPLNGAPWSNSVATQPFLAGVGPQRIRSVRVRAAIRTAFPDRIVNVQPLGGLPYMYRYFIPGVANGLQWARVRTGVTEASLPNQARSYF